MSLTRDIEKYAQDYNLSPFEHILVKYRRKKVLEILNKYKPKNILEVGCGRDSIFNYYKDYDLFTVVEPSTEFCDLARSSHNYNENITIINGFLEEEITKCAIQKYDFIVISCLLHEVPKPHLFLSTIKQLSDLKTIIHINVPNSKSFHLLWAYKSGLIPKLGIQTETSKKLQQNTVFDMEILINIVETNGFKVKEQGSYFIKPFNHSKMQSLVNDNYIDDKLLDGLYEMSEYMPDLGAEIFVNCEVKE
ncbi:MAG: class I SAM-dependent methyltransferase [Candidatus Gastranaerophilaceae bacterium]